jgi:hypothetical protein
MRLMVIMGWFRCEERRLSDGTEFYQARASAGTRAVQYLVCQSTAISLTPQKRKK